MGVCVLTYPGRNSDCIFPEMKPLEFHRASEVELLKAEENNIKLVLAQSIRFFLSLKTNKQRIFTLESPFALMKYQ